MEFLRKHYGDSMYCIVCLVIVSIYCRHFHHVRKSLFLYLYRWVHLICALYTPGVTFDIPEKLEGVVLIDMPTSKWGAKVSFMHCSSE